MGMTTPPAMVQMRVTCLAIYSDKGPSPIFPRWLAYVSFLVAIHVPAWILCVPFRTGSLAWNEIIADGLPTMSFPFGHVDLMAVWP
jgi:hypothetical protein